MNINFNFHKTLEILSKIKLPYLTIFSAFISSFNLWFLSIYFFNNDFFVSHGLTISLLTSFALTVSWCLITGICVPKFIIKYFLDTNPSSLADFDSEQTQTPLTFFIFSEIILLHSFFLWLQYIFHWSFALLISVQFWFAVAQYVYVDYKVKSAYDKFLKSTNTDN